MVGEPDRVAVVEDGDAGLHELGVDEVLAHLADHRVGDAAPLRLRELVGLCRNVLYIACDVARLDVDDARSREKIVVDGDPRGDEQRIPPVFVGHVQIPLFILNVKKPSYPQTN